jgi:hypothetical protein
MPSWHAGLASRRTSCGEHQKLIGRYQLNPYILKDQVQDKAAEQAERQSNEQQTTIPEGWSELGSVMSPLN